MSHQLEKYKDYYLDKDRVIFTAAFHINRGSCCGNGCRHCPYTKPHKRGNTKLLDKNDSTKTNGA
jgi:2-iminoacetate synthase ThiH